jgi:hypothetical protein
MDISPAFPPVAAGVTTYARARLRLGIASVGTIVVASVGLLATGAAHDYLPDSRSWAITDVAWLCLVVALYIAAAAPFDVLGGSVLPRRYGRFAPASYAAAWLRGVVVHGGCLVVCASVLLAAGRWAGDIAVVVASLLLVVALIGLQLPIAALIAGLRTSGDLVRASDASFVGGIVGLPGRERIVVPAAWDGRITRVQMARRSAVRQSGSRTRGLLVATSFNTCGLALILVTTSASGSSVAGLTTLALWMTLWSFLGLLVLPSLSRPAVIAADRAALAHGVERRDLERALEMLDAWQEDEPRRDRLVETIFHPVPSLDRRRAALTGEQNPTLPLPWHTARMALLLSWAGLGLLSRAVHCNCGRPELWAIFPGD